MANKKRLKIIEQRKKTKNRSNEKLFLPDNTRSFREL